MRTLSHHATTAFLCVAALLEGCGDPLTPIPPNPRRAVPSVPLCVSNIDCHGAEECVHGRCLSCMPSVPQCSGDLTLVRCTASGEWEDLQTCDTSCVDGQCRGSQSCNIAQTCNGPASCCKADFVGGGDFLFRYESAIADGANAPRGEMMLHVPGFVLDRYEVTVGRFRQFLDGFGPERRPPQGAGEYRDVEGSGWDVAWSNDYAKLPDGEAGLFSMVQQRSATIDWSTDDNLPISGVNWFTAFAFCIWDGGRLPTEAEWAFAASGGELRVYPWSTSETDDQIDAEHAAYSDGASAPLVVGSKPMGRGKYGEEDLAGNLAEWVFDAYYDDLKSAPCQGPQSHVCVDGPVQRVVRGGSYLNSARGLQNVMRTFGNDSSGTTYIGFRCAR
jgi:sulfatase modifying factor 1